MTPALADAWTRKQTTKLETILTAGDELTRASWQNAIQAFNDSAGDVDLAREKLRVLIASSEATLSQYQIDYSKIPIKRSKNLKGFAAVTRMERTFAQKLNYAQGTAYIVPRAVFGQLPWQLAPIAIAGTVVMHFINQSKAMRQLKEMEGKLVVNAQAAQGDFAMLRSVLTTRVIPQYDGFLEVIEGMETTLPLLAADSSASGKDNAFDLAQLLVDGRHLLSLAAGD